MGAETKISWADATQNFWVGCTRVSAACDFCYAARWAERSGHAELWDGARRRTKTWGEPLKWNARATRTGARPRVFCSSLADFFDNEVPAQWRVEAWDVIRRTTSLRWMLVTKRIGNVAKMVPPDWPMAHVGLIITAENQEVWDRDVPKLLRTPSPWRGVSVEPMLGPVVMSSVEGFAQVDWVIVGGESGSKRRPLDLAWVRSLQRQCDRVGVSFHFKQHGGLHPGDGGCLLDGREYKEFPRALAA